MAKATSRKSGTGFARSLPRAHEAPVEGWLLALEEHPRVSKVIVFKRTADDRWKRIDASWDLYAPFDQDVEPLFHANGDGGYRFVAVIGGKLAATYTEDVTGYGRHTGRGW